MGVRLYDVARQLLAGRGRARRGRAAREKGRWRLGRKAHRTGVVVVAVGARHIGHLKLYDVVRVRRGLRSEKCASDSQTKATHVTGACIRRNPGRAPAHGTTALTPSGAAEAPGFGIPSEDRSIKIPTGQAVGQSRLQGRYNPTADLHAPEIEA